MTKRFDVVVMGSGAAGLVSALAAADSGAQVLVLERAPVFGGTTAISGGQIWVPNNPLLEASGHSDTPALAKTYLRELTLGMVAEAYLDAFLEYAPRMVSFLQAEAGLHLFSVKRPDYHSEWVGAGYGRSLEPMPFDAGALGPAAASLRRSPYRPPVTSAEAKQGVDAALIESRKKSNVVTQGAALVAALLGACLKRGVTLRTGCRAQTLLQSDGHARGLRYRHLGQDESVDATSIIVASGGFEWNDDLKRAFLKMPDEGAVSPPWNEGDGLLMSLRAGAAVDGMTEAWWSAAFSIPGETYDGKPLHRNIVRELALPGSILVNRQGRRFVNEASSYNDLGKAFQVFDPGLNRHVNRHAWLVFDARFKGAYPVGSIAPASPAPDWFMSAPSLSELARKCDIDADGLTSEVDRFNAFARAGVDHDFSRGSARHDQYHGDGSCKHSNLAELALAPYYAIPIFLGNLGTKGGMKTSIDGAVLDHAGAEIPGLFACGNAAASWMGPGYPGAGGSLGPIMTAAMLCGRAAAAAVAPQ